MKLNSKKDYRIIGGSGLLFFAALIWGTAFVAQSVGAESLDGFSFTAIRSLIGSIVLLPFVKIAKQKHFADGVLVEVQERARERTQENAQKRVRESTQESGQRIVSQYVGSSFLGLRRIEWIGGFFCGLALFAATNFQQFGIGMTTVGKAGFITALYVVIVPVMGLFF